MPDREKAMHGLECCSAPGGNCEICPYEIVEGFADCTSALANDALAMLKEQQQQIWELQDQVEYLTDKQKEQKFLVDSDGKITPLQEIVRCKDCTYYLPLVHSCQHLPATVANPNGFCSDGKRREESDE